MTTLAKDRPATTRRALLVTLAVALLVALVSPTATQAVEVDPPLAGDSVLVVAPSPGADVAMAAGITSELPSYAGGAGVTIAYVTNGDFNGDEVAGTARQGEAVTAQTTYLNRAEADLIFFGYPDGYLKPVWDTAAPTVWAHPISGRVETYATRGLGSTDWFDFRSGAGEQHADYNGDAMLADMVALITERRPDHIFAPSGENALDDYKTTYELVTDAVEDVIAADPTYGTIVHTAVVWHPDTALHSTWPQDIDPTSDIVQDIVADPTASPTLDSLGLTWATREQFVVPTAMQDPDVTPPSDNDKVMAVNEHTSIGGLGDILSRFIHRDEIFWAETYAVISVADATVTEGGTAEFTISRTGPTNYPVSVTAATSDGTATAPGDYTAQAATVVTIPAEAASVTFDVPTVDNDIDDGDRAFSVTLTAPSSPSVLGDAVATGTITDDDTAGVTIDVGDGLTVFEGGPSDTYSVALDSEPTANVVITVTPDAQVTAAPSPLTFTPANWDTPQSVIVTGIADGVDEPAHTGTISHTAASTDAKYDGITVADATVTITDTGELTVAVSGPTTWSTGLVAEYSATVTVAGSGTVSFAWAVTRGAATIATGTGADFSFTPTLGGAHTVTVTPSDDDGAGTPVAVTTNVLTDIEDSIFVQDIIWLADNGITRGCNPPVNDEFCPNANVNRGQMAAFLVRFLDLTDVDPTISFTDTAGNTFEQDILKLATAGITRGCNPPTNDRYCPDNNVTRGQMAAFLVRALGLTDVDPTVSFTDTVGNTFEDDIDKLATAGITRGCNPPTNDRFCPDNNVTRGQMAAFIRRAAALP